MRTIQDMKAELECLQVNIEDLKQAIQAAELEASLDNRTKRFAENALASIQANCTARQLTTHGRGCTAQWVDSLTGETFTLTVAQR